MATNNNPWCKVVASATYPTTNISEFRARAEGLAAAAIYHINNGTTEDARVLSMAAAHYGRLAILFPRP